MFIVIWHGCLLSFSFSFSVYVELRWLNTNSVIHLFFFFLTPKPHPPPLPLQSHNIYCLLKCFFKLLKGNNAFHQKWLVAGLNMGIGLSKTKLGVRLLSNHLSQIHQRRVFSALIMTFFFMWEKFAFWFICLLWLISQPGDASTQTFGTTAASDVANSKTSIFCSKMTSTLVSPSATFGLSAASTLESGTASQASNS